MSATLLSWLGLLLGLGVLVGIWLLCRGAAVVAEAEAGQAPAQARKARGPLLDGFCPYCRQPGVYLTRTGQPNRRYHQCDPAAVQAHVWPPAPVDAPKEVA